MSIKAFKGILEDKHFNRLPQSRVFELANKAPEFCSDWLVHSLRSSANIKELLLALAFAEKWNSPVLNTLESYISGFEIDAKAPDFNEIDQTLNILSPQHLNINFERARITLAKLSIGLAQTKKPQILAQEINLYSSELMQNIHQKIINDTEPLLQDVTLFGKSESKGKDSSIRNNFHYPNSIPNNSIELALLERHICKTANISIEYAEPPVILRYEPGQYYKWHYDFIYPHSPEIKNQINQFGQRESTGIYYLSDNCEGGETEFKNLNVSIKPKSGNLVFFKNSDSDGNRNNNSLHKGAEVTKGTKWIVTLWFRSKPYWLRTGLF